MRSFFGIRFPKACVAIAIAIIIVPGSINAGSIVPPNTTANITSGTIGGETLYDTNGYLGIFANGKSNVNISGGTIGLNNVYQSGVGSQGVRIEGGSSLNISGGVIGGNTSYDGAGGASGVTVLGGSTANIYGGTIGGNILLSGGSSDIEALYGSTVNIYGGTIGNDTIKSSGVGWYINAFYGSTVNVSGGTIGGDTVVANSYTVFAGQGSAINITGGNWLNSPSSSQLLAAVDGGVINIVGHGFNYSDGVIPGGGGLLTGTLESGDAFRAEVVGINGGQIVVNGHSLGDGSNTYNSSGDTYTTGVDAGAGSTVNISGGLIGGNTLLNSDGSGGGTSVPEPSTLSLLVLGGIGLSISACRRRRAKA